MFDFFLKILYYISTCMLPLCGGDSFNTIRFRGSMDSTALAPSGPLWVRASGRRPRRFAEAPAGKRQCTSPTLCLVAGKAPWQTARCACRLARCACRSSSQKSRCAAIFGSPICSPLGVSADTRRKSAGISLVSYASVVQWIVQPSHLRGRCGFARAKRHSAEGTPLGVSADTRRESAGIHLI